MTAPPGVVNPDSIDLYPAPDSLLNMERDQSIAPLASFNLVHSAIERRPFFNLFGVALVSNSRTTLIRQISIE